MKKIFILIIVSICSLSMTWEQRVESSKGKTVNFALWGGSENINKWIDSYVAKRMKELYNITLKRIPLVDTEVAIKKLLRDKKLKRDKGSIDLLWVNGENFKIMKKNDLTLAAYLDKLPNLKYIDMKNKSISFDFTENIEGKETPWGSAQMVFIYNADKVKVAPKTTKDFKDWIIQNPGRFTYPSPPDFTGSAFLRLMLMQVNSIEKYNAVVSKKEKVETLTRPLWSFLNEIKPSLYKKGKVHPESISKAHQLFSDEVTWITFDYYPTTAQRMIDKGVFPKNTKTFILNNRTLANTHYTAIPFNSKNPNAAMLLSNFLISPEAQISKQKLDNWGDLNVLNIKHLNKKEKNLLMSLDMGKATLSFDTLNSSKRSELPANVVPIIEKEWKSKVAR